MDEAIQGMTTPRIVRTDVPARLDRLPWGGFHSLVVMALGITWILDGLEVTVAGAVAGALRESPTLHLSSTEVGLASSVYLAGAVIGAAVVAANWDTAAERKPLETVAAPLTLADPRE